MKQTILLTAFLSVIPAITHAQVPYTTSDVTSDSRLRTIAYQAAEVVRLEGCLNFQTMITLAANEHVENVGVGDSSAWQVTPNKRGNLVFVKPLSAHGYSNMTVVTDKRSYNFELKTAPEADCSHGRVLYELRFNYTADAPASTVNPSRPPDPNANLPVPEKRNSAYTYSGAVDLVPIRVFDDGTSTYMKWAAGVTTPAVYALNSDNSESLINYATRGDYIVVEQIAKGFVLRRGEMKSVLYNDAYVVQGLDDQSPKPRARSQGVVK